jgi:hypothetical protein
VGCLVGGVGGAVGARVLLHTKVFSHCPSLQRIPPLARNPNSQAAGHK